VREKLDHAEMGRPTRGICGESAASFDAGLVRTFQLVSCFRRSPQLGGERGVVEGDAQARTGLEFVPRTSARSATVREQDQQPSLTSA